MKTLRRIGLSALALTAVSMLGLSQIVRLTLDEMVEQTDNAIHGIITGKNVFRVDDPIDGPQLYYTTLTIEGRSLVDGRLLTVDVTFHGGFINETEGVWNSEAPSADDTQIGNTIVAFYKWADNMGGRVSGNALYAAHGGLYRSAMGPDGAVVLGRGDGYALNRNMRLEHLDDAITLIHNRLQEQR